MSDHAGAGVRFQAPRLRNVNFAAFSLQTAITKEETMKKVRKKDTAEFEKSMELLCNNMLLFGHNDYMEFCNSIMETLGQNRGAA